ncbi:Uncharacterised protein family protein [Granulicella rosea]|uniref:Uncharacterized protein YtcA n=1 Tax=Granulicella rosea TaxID=474952 RepID=A0A239GUF9_9BACT|nr:YtcA family lipoprotein [Granulicella rosea]SNS72757.1 Uncharacterised protein family protein [Granulicella rosea]
MNARTSSLLLLSAAPMTGCNRNPNVEIVGSYFPGWMVCLVAAVALAGVVHAVLRSRRAHLSIGHPAAVYPAMVVLFTCLLWLCIFA